MKTKITVFLILLLGSTGSTLVMAKEGEQLFNKLCVSCHQLQGPPVNAPPIFAVVNHVKSAYPDREGFVERIVAWVKDPSVNDVLMPGAVRRFGVMPKLPYMASDVRIVAEYLYDGKFQLPKWYGEHYKREHGVAPKQ